MVDSILNFLGGTFENMCSCRDAGELQAQSKPENSPTQRALAFRGKNENHRLELVQLAQLTKRMEELQGNLFIAATQMHANDISNLDLDERKRTVGSIEQKLVALRTELAKQEEVVRRCEDATLDVRNKRTAVFRSDTSDPLFAGSNSQATLGEAGPTQFSQSMGQLLRQTSPMRSGSFRKRRVSVGGAEQAALTPRQGATSPSAKRAVSPMAARAQGHVTPRLSQGSFRSSDTSDVRDSPPGPSNPAPAFLPCYRSTPICSSPLFRPAPRSPSPPGQKPPPHTRETKCALLTAQSWTARPLHASTRLLTAEIIRHGPPRCGESRQPFPAT